jgi:hypothetical protein
MAPQTVPLFFFLLFSLFSFSKIAYPLTSNLSLPLETNETNKVIPIWSQGKVHSVLIS